MTIEDFLPRYRRFWHSLFKWRYEATLYYKLILAFTFAALTGLAAQVRIPLPWTPVPVTAQTLIVLLSGVYLGRWWGGISQGLYWTIGAMGVPWGSGLRGGIGWALGPTAGYLLGFVIIALLLGHFTDKHIRFRTFSGNLPLMLVATAVIYFFGAFYLAIYLDLSAEQTIIMGVLPFVPGDLSKVFIAAAIVKVTAPKTAYNGEVDVDEWKKWRYP